MPSRARFDSDRIENELHKGIRRGLNLITLSLQRRIKNKLSKPGSGRMYGKHQASAADGKSPPAARTGNLRNSWTAAARITTPKVRPGVGMGMEYGPGNVGGAAKYAWALEYGHVYSNRVLKPRPYVRPSIERLQRGGRVQKIMDSQLKKAVNNANKAVQ